MKCRIINIAREIFFDNILNENIQFFSRELFAMGMDISSQNLSINNSEGILKAFKVGIDRSDILIINCYLEDVDYNIIKELEIEFFESDLNLNKEDLNFDSNNSNIGSKIILIEGNKILSVIKGIVYKTRVDFINYIKPYIEQIKNSSNNKYYEFNNESIQFSVAKSLVDKELTIGSAESCTGGLIASRLIDYPGISNSFLEGAVTYSNEAKVRTLHVKKETLEKFGAVSEETAKEMAEGIAKRCNSDIGISTTGIAGPGGGTDDKPVGLVYIGIYVRGEIFVERHIFLGDRKTVRNKACIEALDLIRREISKIK